MLHLLWELMLAVGIAYGFIAGKPEAVGAAVISSAREAVALSITMLGIVALWSGLMEVAQAGGILKGLERLLAAPVSWLFPKVPKGHPAQKAMLLNITANMLGLGWAATPAGLLAMKELAKLEEERPSVPKGSASNAMCDFLILNVSSLQLISVNLIAYRSQYGSAAPMAIVLPSLAATAVSTAVAVLFCKVHKT